MFQSSTFFFIIGLLFISGINTQCTCGNVQPDSQQQTAQLQVSSEEELVDGNSIGKLVQVGTIVYTQNDFPCIRSLSSLSHSCPSGWRPMNLNELTNLINYKTQTSTEYFLNSNYLKMTSTLYYMSSEKTYPSNTDGTQNAAWEFKGIQFTNNVPSIISIETYFKGNDGKLRVKCVRDLTSQSILQISGIPKTDFTNGQVESLTILNTNLEQFQWNFDNSTVYSSSKSISFMPVVNSNYCGKLIIKARFFGGETAAWCQVYYAFPLLGTFSDATVSFTQSSITKVTVPNILAVRRTGMHFGPGSVPIAPKLSGGGAYVAYSVQTTNEIKVLEIDNNGAVSQTYSLGVNGAVFDIITRTWGFVVLIRDEPDTHKLYMLGWNTQTNQAKFNRILMNNGNQPTAAQPDQVMFKNNQNEPLFGMKAMYNPHNGRLAFVKGKIIATFAHYNHFGYYDNGNRNDHTGDTQIIFDDNGQNEQLAWSWATSHSLYQQVAYDGLNLVTASLGDAYPINIQLQVTLPYQSTQTVKAFSTSSLITGTIPGNGGGKASGRLGGLHYVGCNKLALIYSRRPASGTVDSTTSTNTEDELAIIYFTYNSTANTFTQLSKKVIDTGNLVNTIKSAKHGSNIVIAYTKVASPTANFLDADIKSTDSMYMVVVNKDGNIIVPSFQVNTFSISASDDWEVLSNGKIIWSYVNTDGTLTLNFLPVPTEATSNIITRQYPTQCSFTNNNIENNLNNNNQLPQSQFGYKCLFENILVFVLLLVSILQ